MDQYAREKALRDELKQVRQLVKDVRFLARAGVLKDFTDEPWLKRIMNIDLEFDPVTQVPGEGKSEP